MPRIQDGKLVPAVHLNLERAKVCIIHNCLDTGRIHAVGQDVSIDKDDAWYSGVSFCHHHWEDMMNRYVRNAHKI